MPPTSQQCSVWLTNQIVDDNKNGAVYHKASLASVTKLPLQITA